MNTIVGLVVFMFSCYLGLIFMTILLMTYEEYQTHRNLLLHPERDFLGNITTSITMVNGKLQIKKRASIGATKRLLHKVWSRVGIS